MRYDMTGYFISQLRLLLLITGITLMGGACTLGFYDGMRVANTGSSITLNGFITDPGSPDKDIRVSAYNFTTNTWNLIAQTAVGGSISTSVSYTMADGTKLYLWDIGSKVLAAAYWKAGTNGSYARLKAEWYKNGSLVAKLYNPRSDWATCYWENRNGQANTLAYLLPNCFSHRGEAYIYTANYREGSIFCPAPDPALSKSHGHYMLNQIPACAQQIIYNRMAERVNRSLIDDHYEIMHHDASMAHMVDAAGEYNLGGFFGGHENYIRKMERHVMVYDYPWMPKGKIPAWKPDTAVPVAFQASVASASGNCNSQTSGCSGWLSGSLGNTNPGIATPVGILPGNVCGYATTAALHPAVKGWHDNVHVTVGGGVFNTFDSPSFPLFFLWHNYVQDVWLDWKTCGFAGP